MTARRAKPVVKRRPPHAGRLLDDIDGDVNRKRGHHAEEEEEEDDDDALEMFGIDTAQDSKTFANVRNPTQSLCCLSFPFTACICGRIALVLHTACCFCSSTPAASPIFLSLFLRNI